MDCLFCKILKKEIPCDFIYEDEDTVAFLDINPVSVGHTLVIPKKHVHNFEDITLKNIEAINKTGKIIYHALKDGLNPDGIRLVQNNGFFQEIPHYHLHLIPGFKKDVELSLDEVKKILKKTVKLNS